MSQSAHLMNWFEIPVKNLGRAKSFYEKVLGISLNLSELGKMKLAFFPMEKGASGSTGTLVQAETYVPSHHGSIIYFSVADINASMKKVSEMNGKVLMPKTKIGEYGFIGHFEDSEGNRVGVHQM